MNGQSIMLLSSSMYSLLPDILPRPARVAARFFTKHFPVNFPSPKFPRDGGGFSPDERDYMREGLGILPEEEEAPLQWSLLRQCHGTDILTIHRPEDISGIEHPIQADAQITTCPHVALGVLTADCVPVVFYTRGGSMIAVAHAGWRGLHGGIIPKTVAQMVACGAQASEIIACIGPHIHAVSYEVDGGFYRDFLALDALYGRWFTPGARPGHYLFDLRGVAFHQLKQAGVGTMGDVDENTYTQPDRWWSHRYTTHHGGVRGSLLSAIRLGHAV